MESSNKKIERKNKRKQHTLERETGCICSEIPTENLGICNAGLVNGLSEYTLFENFSKYGPIKTIKLIPGKSSSFVQYFNLEDSIEAYKKTNGTLKIAQDNKPIFLAYVKTLPEITPHISFDSPPGLIILNDFVSEEEEQTLLNSISGNTNDNLKFRQVRHFGFEFRYDINNVDKDSPLEETIPESCTFLWERLKNKINFDFNPDQLTVNYYNPGHGIPSHVDTHSAFEDPIVSLSLGSSVVMEFKHENGKCFCVFLPRRSLTLMTEESRYDWTHGITPRKFDVIPGEKGLSVYKRDVRISFTFRKVRKGECHCNYKNKCDSFLKMDRGEVVGDGVASKLENLHVHEVYENIGSHFSKTRHKPWPNVLNFVQSLDVGSVLIDVGCGNGKYLGQNKTIYEIGCDRSSCLINLSYKKGFEVFICNCVNLPFIDGCADAIISIAVIHHLATLERRIRAIREIARVLKIKGRALIYVWAKEQNKDNVKSSYLKQDRKNRKENISERNFSMKEVTIAGTIFPIHNNRTEFECKDMLVPWKLKESGKEVNSYLRYYHVFEEGEIENVCATVENITIVKSYYDQGNWCVILEKK